jgi:hypothetical protein
MTECREQVLLFQAEKSKKVVGKFSGGEMSSDGGLVLLREFEKSFGVTRR